MMIVAGIVATEDECQPAIDRHPHDISIRPGRCLGKTRQRLPIGGTQVRRPIEDMIDQTLDRIHRDEMTIPDDGTGILDRVDSMAGESREQKFEAGQLVIDEVAAIVDDDVKGAPGGINDSRQKGFIALIANVNVAAVAGERLAIRIDVDAVNLCIGKKCLLHANRSVALKSDFANLLDGFADVAKVHPIVEKVVVESYGGFKLLPQFF